jgi:DNA repair protein RadD
MKLRAHQLKSIDDMVASFKRGNRRIILCACTAYGKTILGAEVIRRAISKGKNVLWLADRKELIWQAKKRFEDFGIGEYVGVIMSGEESALERQVQIASVMTYARRLKLVDLALNKWLHKADLVIYDECHGSLANVRRGILELYDDKYLIGLSATPGRSDRAAMGEIYQDIIMGATIADLTEMGFLVKVRYFGAKEQPELKGVGVKCGEWEQSELGKRVNKPKLVGDILESWLKIAGGQQTIIFATNVKHSLHIKEVFLKKGINIEHVDAHTPREERLEILEGLQTGRINIVTNCGVYVEGVDVPSASVCVLAKPVRFIGRYIQMCGRVLRPYPGKDEAIIIDHACCVGPPHGHGFLDEPVDWVLDGKDIVPIKKRKPKEKTIITCEYCSTMFTGRICPTCGHEVKGYPKKIESIEAEIVEIGPKQKDKKDKYSTEDKRIIYGMLEYERRRLGKSDKWLLAQYKSMTSVWPIGMNDIGPIEPDAKVLNWLKYQRIRWAKKKSHDKQHAE